MINQRLKTKYRNLGSTFGGLQAPSKPTANEIVESGEI